MPTSGALADHAQGVDSALAGHGQVHDQHIEFGSADQVDGLAAAGSFSDDAQVDLFGEKLLQPRPHDGMVIHNSDFDHVWFSFAMTSTGPFVQQQRKGPSPSSVDYWRFYS